MKILVTGANGYLGTGVVKQLCNDNIDVVAACHTKSNMVDERARIKQCDIFELEDPFNYFEQPDILLHMAWRNGFIHYSDTHIQDLPQHFLFLKKMAESGTKQIAVMGSMHEIGFYEGSIDESTQCHPITPYGISKNALRDLTQMLCEQNKIIFQWLRGYYIVGNSSDGCSIFSKISAAVDEQKKEFPFTMGQNQYDFIDYSDFCVQVAAVVEQNQKNGIINICSGMPEKLADRVERYIKENNYSIVLKYGAFPDRPYDSKAIWGNDKKTKQILESYK